jgi:phage replication-related protein YjqB (UPF0714/DUF867 family)
MRGNGFNDGARIVVWQIDTGPSQTSQRTKRKTWTSEFDRMNATVRLLLIAPHGGGIEPGTSELAEAIAGDDLSFYSFEGLKKRGNGVLHITSSRFDEPNAMALVAASPAAIALHGELDCPDQVVFLGGLDKELGKRIQAALEAAGFVVRIHDDPNLQGVDKNNICNRGRSGQGVQLELSQPLRDSFFPSFDRRGREKRTQQGDRFVDAMRKAILGGNAGEASKADKTNES